MESLGIVLTNPDLTHPRGAQRQVLEFASHWSRLGHEVNVIVGEKATPYAFDGIISIPIHVIGPLTKRRRMPGVGVLDALHTHRTLQRMASAADALRPDIVNAHNHPTQYAPTKSPKAWTCNEPPPWHYFPEPVTLYTTIMRAKDRNAPKTIMALDANMAATIKAAYPDSAVTVTGSGCSLQPLPLRTSKGRHILCVLGNLNHQKRPDAAIQACRKLDATLHIVGSGGDPAHLHALAKHHGVQLRLHHQVTESELLQLYANVDAGIYLPTKQPWGIFPLECILAEKPCIIGTEVGSREVLPTDYPYEARDTKHANRLLQSALNDPKTARIQAAARHLREHYSWGACSLRVLEVLKTAMEN